MIQLATQARSLGSSILRRHRRHVSFGAAPGVPGRMFATMPLAEEDVANTYSLLILGKPGGGKGTISGKILSDFPQFRHVSTGDELRQHVRNQTEIGREAKTYMDSELAWSLADTALYYHSLEEMLITILLTLPW